ncbi:MAG: type II 3-dehydroquinate dehydratase [Bacteroidales bacterium]|nr:type II 3-dehydroquinate dehydratase [Bacteroidales bacterium]
MKLIIINGPNLNLLGKREPEVYGNESFENYFDKLVQMFPSVNLSYFQSNIEGEIVDKIQEVGYSCDGIIINAGGYSHTSVAIRDAIAAVPAPAVEVHISNVFAREDFRHTLLLAPVCKGCISGLGLRGYAMAVENFL